MKGQEIRPSLYIFTYGVGSILEAPDGPRIIQSIEKWGDIFSRTDTLRFLEDFEIQDSRASSVLRGARFFRLPTNADRRKPWGEVLFAAKPFPMWGLCMKQNHRKLFRIRHSGKTGCPLCSPNEIGTKDAIRFVLACPNGHLQDINWEWILHGNTTECSNKTFEWIEKGNTLADITISCKECGNNRSLADIYRLNFSCPGIYQESSDKEECGAKAVIVLRNASYLRVPEIKSFLTIEPISTDLHMALSERVVRSILFTLDEDKKLNPKEVRTKFERLHSRQETISLKTMMMLKEVSDDELIDASRVILDFDMRPKSEGESLEQEFNALRRAVERGSPPAPTNRIPTLEIERGKSRVLKVSDTLDIRVTPVKRLRVVSVQTGYRRLVGDSRDARLVETAYHNEDLWYIAMEMYGEGIFIDMPPDTAFDLSGFNSYQSWFETCESIEDDSKQLNFNPYFVWWHSLSHRFINALGIDSGYSSSSIRERVYCESNKESPVGGVLLYVSQPGQDGTLGGMISLVPKFERIIESAFSYLDSCSNDPLCSERKHMVGSSTGAACYGCLLTSETSCEHRNMYLDRNLLVESLQ